MFLLYILSAVGAVIGIYILVLGVCALLVNPKKEYRTQNRFYRSLLNSAAFIALKLLRIRIHVTGMENLPKDKKLLFVGNHMSNLDPIVTWYTFRKWDIGFISKPSNFRIPIFGRIVRKCCFLPIDRENPRKAIETINKAASLLESQEVSVGVYPEGTRSKTGELLPFHNGVFKIAQKSNATIAVVCVRGTNQFSRHYPWRHTDVYLDVLEVIPGENAKNTSTQMLGVAVQHLLQQKLDDKRNRENL